MDKQSGEYNTNYYLVGRQLGLFEGDDHPIPMYGARMIKVPEESYQRIKKLKETYNLRIKDIVELSTILFDIELHDVMTPPNKNRK